MKAEDTMNQTETPFTQTIQEIGDPRMMAIFASGEDVHTEVAALLYDIPKESVTKPQRTLAKVLVFMSAGKLTPTCSPEALSHCYSDEMPLEEAQQLLDRFQQLFPVQFAHMTKA